MTIMSKDNFKTLFENLFAFNCESYISLETILRA